MEINYIDLGKRIKEQRQSKNITQEKLAELTELSVPHMSGIENGKAKFSFGALIRIVNALEITTDELLCGSLVQGKAIMQSEFSNLLADCGPAEAAFIMDMLKSMKKGLRELGDTQ